MWYDDINKKLEEDDGSNNPAYNEKAWENMELLLDKHLPLKKKRRWLIFLLFPILLAGTTGIFILQKRNADKNFIVEPKTIPVQVLPLPGKVIEKNNTTATASSKIVATPAMQSPAKPVNEQSPNETITQNQVSDKKISERNKKQVRRSKKYVQPPYFLKKMQVKNTDSVNNEFVRNNPATPGDLLNPSDKEITTITDTPFADTDSLSTQKNIYIVEKKQDYINQKADKKVSNPQNRNIHF